MKGIRDGFSLNHEKMDPLVSPLQRTWRLLFWLPSVEGDPERCFDTLQKGLNFYACFYKCNILKLNNKIIL